MNSVSSGALKLALTAVATSFLWLAPGAPAKAQAWVHCATEGGFCGAPGGTVIRYGARGSYARLRSPPGGLPCNNGVFGDPLVGVHKECFFRNWRY
jgi:hypothetical protein